ncbi:TPR-like protein [Lophiostoma macrostomum CBS 122681]|uniref:TPR-like protein n=1 Tax=Lophiostoma macrostomum CBS 122681 TaxID=1314788 RepID=A0A6A6TH17_9PLEO|nr:TPR-like protein [Lophiostoma macrostomum CBS 122681]
MGDVLVKFLRRSLPDELAAVLQDSLQNLEDGNFQALLQDPEVLLLLGHEDNDVTRDIHRKDFSTWSDYVFHRLGLILAKRNEDEGTPPRETAAYRQHLFFIVAVASLYAFLQSNATGPTLPFNPAEVLLPKDVSSNTSARTKLREGLISSLSTDGVAAYRLTPNIELLCLAETILICPPIQKNIEASVWARLRVNFLHQRLLSEVAPSLQKSIYENLDTLGGLLLAPGTSSDDVDIWVHFLLERAAIHTHHGLDKKALADLDQAASERKFVFALTGLMGKRTKFQEKATSQLVVLARSAGTSIADSQTEPEKDAKPTNLDLNDDTLLESISFTEKSSSTDVKTEASLPPALASLDPSDQPLLDPLDSVILLSLASSITNTNPADGLTREETEPYATRVLDGGSSNWQVYTQALLVRSRIEGYKSRTMERGLLQLQALVDQVISETSGAESTATSTSNGDTSTGATSFLPKPKETESAPVSERLRYIFPLCTPSRWDLEAELAARWVHAGGLRTALEIYERLELWAEAALCWAATEKEDKAKRIIRRQLFHATSGTDSDADLDEETWQGAERDPPPAEAPRLYCILGDIDKDAAMYEKAWVVSGKRYARAQRSLGRQYFAGREYAKAAEAYQLVLKVNALNQSSWFALGCAYLELHQFKNAVEAFSRCVQLDDQDAEAWSNLAAALLHLRPKRRAKLADTLLDSEGEAEAGKEVDDKGEDEDDEERRLTSHPRQDALKAFLRAATLKHDDSRIWSNVLAVAASTTPPAYTHILTAQRRLCELRGATDGEKCVDVEVLDMLVKHVVQSQSESQTQPQDPSQFDPVSQDPNPTPHGLPRLLTTLLESHIAPLITSSAPLWTILATFYTHTSRPSSALAAHEKAWRALTSQPLWEAGTEQIWNGVVDQTVDLVDAYETLGPRERREGLAVATGGEGEGDGEKVLVAKDWKFKARSAVRSVEGQVGGVEGGWVDCS